VQFVLFRGRRSGVRGHHGVFRVYFLSELSQVELESGQMCAPASVASEAALVAVVVNAASASKAA
jgi:hypothetical protein